MFHAITQQGVSELYDSSALSDVFVDGGGVNTAPDPSTPLFLNKRKNYSHLCAYN